jgi:Putative peptidoglycan binding domain
MTLELHHPLRPGMHGSDVKATKLAYRRMGVQGSGAMQLSDRAGPAWEHVTRSFQHNHGIKVDGIYGKLTHKRLFEMRRDGKPAFSTWAELLFRRGQKKRNPPPVPIVVDMSAETAARALVTAHVRGEFHDDSGRIMAQVSAAAAGKAVWSPAGHYVFLDRRMLESLVELVQKGYHVGCYAMCSDHPYDAPHGHAGGKAVDISSVNGVSINSHLARQATLNLMTHLHHQMPAVLKPWQLICDGYGYMHDEAISGLSLPAGVGFYGAGTMSQHRNHVHLGYYD